MTSANRGVMWSAATVFVVGLATILAAWGFELIGHYVPCKLCLEERVPYYVGLPLVLLPLIAARISMPTLLPRIFLLAAAIVFAYGAYLGTYHAGAEWGFWAGPSDCGGGSALPTTTDDLLKALKDIKVVSCTGARFRFPDAAWGLSFAGANAVIAALLSLVALWGTLLG